MHTLAKHSMEGLAGEERREARKRSTEEQRQQKRKRKTIKNTAITALIVAALGLSGWWLAGIIPQLDTYSDGQVHWHAALRVEVCGEPRELPSEGESGIAHGEGMAGTLLMHHHDDGVIHIEGVIKKMEDIALGKFTDSIGLVFDRDTLMEKKNGDECAPGEPGQVKMTVNGVPNSEFRDYVPLPTQDANEQVIRLVFG